MIPLISSTLKLKEKRLVARNHTNILTFSTSVPCSELWLSSTSRLLSHTWTNLWSKKIHISLSASILWNLHKPLCLVCLSRWSQTHMSKSSCASSSKSSSATATIRVTLSWPSLSLTTLSLETRSISTQTRLKKPSSKCQCLLSSSHGSARLMKLGCWCSREARKVKPPNLVSSCYQRLNLCSQTVWTDFPGLIACTYTCSAIESSPLWHYHLI